MRYKSNSKNQTQKLAKKIAKSALGKSVGKKAVALALEGDLGSGKTTFVQGFLRGLGVRGPLTSPTFVLMKKYELRNKTYARAFHVDAYRIQKPIELLNLGLKEILADPRNIVLIEWAEKIKKLLPKNSAWLKFEHGENAERRIINIIENWIRY